MIMVEIMDKYVNYQSTSLHFYRHLENAPSNHTDLVEHVDPSTRYSPRRTYKAHACQHDTKPGTPGTLITAMPNY